MPTTGRLVGAICFAALGLYLGYLAQPFFEEGRIPTYWWPLCGLAGAWSGWVVVGKTRWTGLFACDWQWPDGNRNTHFLDFVHHVFRGHDRKVVSAVV